MMNRLISLSVCVVCCVCVSEVYPCAAYEEVVLMRLAISPKSIPNVCLIDHFVRLGKDSYW